MDLPREGTRSRRRTRLAAPVWGLLLVLALVPTLGMGAFAASEAQEKADVAEAAERVAEGTSELVQLLDLLFALTNEQAPTQALLRAGTFPVSLDQASELIGFDIVARYQTARDETDVALGSVSAQRVDPAVSEIVAELPALRRRADEPGADAAEIDASFRRLVEVARDASVVKMAELSGGPQLVDRRVAESLQGLAAVVSTFEGFQQQLVAMGYVLFEPDDPEVRIELASGIAEYRSARRLLARQQDPTVREGWRRIAETSDVERLDRSVDETLADPSWLSGGSPDRMAGVFADGFVENDLLARLSRETGERGVALALDAEREARDAHRRTIAISTVLGLIAVASSFAVSRSISRPLRILARRAGMVANGNLVDTGMSGGPKEVRTVARALSEMSGSLCRIEEQAQALAAGDHDDIVLATALPGKLGASVQASVVALSSSLRAQEELRCRLLSQAHHDPLTGLCNRTGFLEAADKALARARRTGQQVALLVIDLDGFKRANDAHGHKFGDQVLVTMGERLVALARAGDTVARLGGDEFVVIAEPMASIELAVSLGGRLVASLSEPLLLDGRAARMGASVGVALSHGGRQTALDLLADADQAVSRAKRAGGGHVEVFDEVLRRELAARNDIEQALRAGIAGGELELHYQPVVEARSGRLRGFEALVRWDRPGHGLVPPMDFVPVAEASDLVDDLGRWVLQEATDQLAAWSVIPELADIHVSVNISGRHLLDPSIVGDVRRALDRSGVSPDRVVIEITETVLLSDLDAAISHLASLRELGVRIALDDFGTGYTSIGQLGQLPLDILKIDRAFVSGLHEQGDRSLVELMVGVARTLGLGLVAEGVEDHEQLDVLRELACDDIQGYLIARPLRVADAVAWAMHPADDPGGVRAALARVRSIEQVVG